MKLLEEFTRRELTLPPRPTFRPIPAPEKPERSVDSSRSRRRRDESTRPAESKPGSKGPAGRPERPAVSNTHAGSQGSDSEAASDDNDKKQELPSAKLKAAPPSPKVSDKSSLVASGESLINKDVVNDASSPIGSGAAEESDAAGRVAADASPANEPADVAQPKRDDAPKDATTRVRSAASGSQVSSSDSVETSQLAANPDALSSLDADQADAKDTGGSTMDESTTVNSGSGGGDGASEPSAADGTKKKRRRRRGKRRGGK